MSNFSKLMGFFTLVRAWPSGVTFTPSFTLGVSTLYCLEEQRGEQGDFGLGDNFTPREQSSPLASHFTPRGEIYDRPQIVYEFPFTEFQYLINI
jgi:hypothetical protein